MDKFWVLIFPRYHLNLGRYKLPVSEYQVVGQKQVRKLYLNDGYRRDAKIFCCLLMFMGKGGGIVSSITNGSVKSWSQSSDKIGGWFAIDIPGITNDIDGGVNIGGFRYIDDRHVYSIIDLV